MSYRFLRENSQVLAASISSGIVSLRVIKVKFKKIVSYIKLFLGYCLFYMLYKNNECDIFKELHYEFKNKKMLYEGLTLTEEEKMRKV